MAKKNGSLELAARNGLIKRNRMACHLFQNAGADTKCADLNRFMALEMLLQKKSPGGSRGPDRCQQQTDKDRNMEAQSHKYPSSNKKDTPIYIYICTQTSTHKSYLGLEDTHWSRKRPRSTSAGASLETVGPRSFASGAQKKRKKRGESVIAELKGTEAGSLMCSTISATPSWQTYGCSNFESTYCL